MQYSSSITLIAVCALAFFTCVIAATLTQICRCLDDMGRLLAESNKLNVERNQIAHEHLEHLKSWDKNDDDGTDIVQLCDSCGCELSDSDLENWCTPDEDDEDDYL